MKMNTNSNDKIQFKNAIKLSSIEEIIGKVIKIVKLKFDIQGETWIEEMFSYIYFKAANSTHNVHTEILVLF